jgi:hypothetical protein
LNTAILKRIQITKPGDSVKISVDVKNTGALAGDEIVQGYVSARGAGKISVPLRSLKHLKGFICNLAKLKLSILIYHRMLFHISMTRIKRKY